MIRPSTAATLALLALATPPAGAGAAQEVETGFLDRAVSVSGQGHRYQVYVTGWLFAQRRP